MPTTRQAGTERERRLASLDDLSLTIEQASLALRRCVVKLRELRMTLTETSELTLTQAAARGSEILRALIQLGYRSPEARYNFWRSVNGVGHLVKDSEIDTLPERDRIRVRLYLQQCFERATVLREQSEGTVSATQEGQAIQP